MSCFGPSTVAERLWLADVAYEDPNSRELATEFLADVSALGEDVAVESWRLRLDNVRRAQER